MSTVPIPMEAAPHRVPQIHATPALRRRFHFLDMLRGVAAICVAMGHGSWMMPKELRIPSGFFSVDLFFCLSGFVIAFAYEHRIAKGLPLRQYVAARWIRLFPLYLLGSALGALALFTVDKAALHAASQHHVLALLGSSALMIPNLGMWPGPLLYPLDDPAWSLFFEILINLAFGLVLRFCKTPAWLYPCIAAVSFFFLFRAAEVNIPLFNLGWPNNTAMMPLGLARAALPFSLGVSVLHLYRRWSGRRTISPTVQAVLALCVLIGFMTIVFSTSTYAIRILLSTLLFPVLIFLGAAVRLGSMWKEVGAWLGDISYPIYLLHIPLMHLFVPMMYRVVGHAPMLRPLLGAPFLGPLFLIALCLISYASLRLYDAPVRDWLSSMLIRRPSRFAVQRTGKA